MKKKKKTTLSVRRALNNKIILKLSIIIIIFIIVIVFFIINNRQKDNLNNNSQYYIGNLYSANQAANMLDHYTSENAVISPLNVNSTLAILYNGTDNNTNKELKKYFRSTSNEVNKQLTTKLKNFINEDKITNEYTELYEEYIQKIEDSKYHNLTSSTIKLLSTSEKRTLQELLEKINLIHDYLNNKNDLSIKYIEDYKITDDVITNEYTLESLLIKVLDDYETYSINNKIVNYHELFVSNDLDTINENYLDDLSQYNTSITHLDLTDSLNTSSYINDKIKETTDNNISRVIEPKDINSQNLMINSFYFNYEWANSISSNNVKNEEFYELNGDISQVEMMYSKESKYLENNVARGFIKDFQNGQYSYVGILPKSEGDFTLSSLNLDSLLQSVKEEDITIGLPKYSLSSEVPIVDLLKDQNISEVFTSKANFTKITDQDFSLTKNIQATYFQIGEKGTYQSEIRVTNFESYTEEEDEKKIILNRPFCFLVINNETEDILLIGKIKTFN